MTIVVIRDRVVVAGKARRPGELLEVPDNEGRALVEAGDARERKAPGPAETKEAL